MTAPFDERLLFEHDLATPFSNLRGCCYILETALESPTPEILEAIDILKNSAYTLEKTLKWYWALRMLETECAPVAPWRAERLATEIAHAIREFGLPLSLPDLSGDLSALRLTAPPQALRLGLLGAALTLSAAGQDAVNWGLSASTGVLRVEIRIEGGPALLDPSRLFRKLWWPPRPGATDSPSDPGLPYLAALLARHRGGCELVWREDAWRFEAWLPGEESSQ